MYKFTLCKENGFYAVDIHTGVDTNPKLPYMLSSKYTCVLDDYP